MDHILCRELLGFVRTNYGSRPVISPAATRLQGIPAPPITTLTYTFSRYDIFVIHSLKAGALAFAILTAGACSNTDPLGPAAETAASVTPELTTTATPPGIVFASYGLTPSQLNSVHTGIVRGTSPSTILSYLSQVKMKGGRVLVVLAGDAASRNDDGTFNLTKWKAAVDVFRSVNFSSYITDGTIVGHYIIDEPHFPSRWGGHVIPQSTVEAAAKYSKQLWPSLPTIVNAPLQWLAGSTITYTYLDAGWAMYRASTSSNPSTWAANQVAAAKKKGLGVFGGLNVLDGGDGSSGFHGNLAGKWAMSASELRSYGSAILAQSYVCGFAMWKYSSTYYDRSDIKSAMSDLSTKARNHLKTSCKQ